MLIAEFSYRLPFFLIRADIIVKIAVVIRLCDKRRHISAGLLPYPLKPLRIKPRKNHVVLNVFRQNTRIIGFHRPRVVSMVVAFEKNNLFLPGKRPRAKYGESGGVGTVFHKISPVGAFDRVGKKLGALYHFVGRRRDAVALFKLFGCRGVHLGVVIS